MVRPIIGQLNTGPITTVRPIIKQLDRGPITTVPITEQLDFRPIDITCNFCTALYQIDKCISILQPSNPQFKTCCKYGNINLPLFQPLLEYLYDLLESYNTSARRFRERLYIYNTVLAFISINYTVTNYNIAQGGLNYFQIYSKLYYLQGPLESFINITLQYIQLYFYNFSYTIDIQLQAYSNTQLDITILWYLTTILSNI